MTTANFNVTLTREGDSVSVVVESPIFTDGSITSTITGETIDPENSSLVSMLLGNASSIIKGELKPFITAQLSELASE